MVFWGCGGGKSEAVGVRSKPEFNYMHVVLVQFMIHSVAKKM